jgi:uncharacterized membrane protein YvlD (DUF360 family)
MNTLLLRYILATLLGIISGVVASFYLDAVHAMLIGAVVATLIRVGSRAVKPIVDFLDGLGP